MKTTTLNRLMTIALPLALTACIASDNEHSAPAIVVQTSSGRVAAEPVAEGALAYRDIPYATPPVGPLRWAAPEPLDTPNGIFKHARLP